MKIYTEADFFHGDLEQLEDIENWKDCADLCLANEKCLYFTYQQARRTCWLKDWIQIIFKSNLLKEHIKFIYKLQLISFKKIALRNFRLKRNVRQQRELDVAFQTIP